MARVAAAPDTWMPLWIGPYLANTLHLNRAQHGSYQLLIMACWKAGGRLPANDPTLATIARCTDREWKAERTIFAAFFEVDAEWWTHPRVVIELQKAAAFKEKQTQNGGKGGRPPKPDETQREPKHNPEKTTLPLPSQEERTDRGAPSGRTPDETPRLIAAREGGPGGADAHDVVTRITNARKMP